MQSSIPLLSEPGMLAAGNWNTMRPCISCGLHAHECFRCCPLSAVQGCVHRASCSVWRIPDTVGCMAQVVLDTLEYGSAIKKTPVVVGNCTGFAVNRVFFPYTQAACLLVDLGLDPYKIDKAILGGFGMPMGPFRCRQLTAACHDCPA